MHEPWKVLVPQSVECQISFLRAIVKTLSRGTNPTGLIHMGYPNGKGEERGSA